MPRRSLFRNSAVALFFTLTTVSAADFGSAMAQYQQGNYAAARWEFSLLADQGDADAQLVLADMHAKGQGGKTDNVQAYKWYTLADRNGARDAAKARDVLAKKMKPGEIAEAERLAASWKPSAGAVAEGSAKTEAAGTATPAPTTAAAAAPAASGGGFFSKIARGATGLLGGPNASGAGPAQATSTIGIRGLSAEELRSASPNVGALQQLEGFQASEGDAAGFARSANLAPQSVQYLASPASAASSSSTRNPLTGE